MLLLLLVFYPGGLLGNRVSTAERM
jgi:hypothetical protein